ncbi:methylated-DNA--[protein]-cysteine S-methyltransferase [Endozoicomonas montiporae]|nr:methylated-DNA--[protein]-cysteine S-methyltransferase [Endozoicomonas montiporae]
MQEYMQGKRRSFDVPVKPEGTLFQKQVWQKLLEIPYGATVSYSELASSINNPKASRAVGAAVGKNPLLVFIPCHRVIGSSGALTGYAGGLEAKKWLLTLENP